MIFGGGSDCRPPGGSGSTGEVYQARDTRRDCDAVADRIARRTCRLANAAVLVTLICGSWAAAPGHAQTAGETTVLRAARILDGRGGVLENRDIVVRDGQIAEIVARGDGQGDRTYDLTALTLLPGYIDTHVHIGAHFDEDGKLHPPAEGTIGHRTLYGAENAYRTLMDGITTVQSLGSPDDAELKAWITRGEIPGPRLLSSLGSVREATGTPAQIRAFVQDRAAAGADVVKIFASTSIRFGGVTTLSAAQLEAACGEARAHGLRSVVHAHRSDAIRLAADAGCTQIEHGWLLEPADLEVFQRAVVTPGVRIVYSTDANAGSHGANTDELVAYVQQGGQAPMDAVVSATSLAAESLGLGDRIGAIASGFEADLIALDGDPLTDPPPWAGWSS